MSSHYKSAETSERVQKAKYFTAKQAELISGLSRSQLEKLSQIELVLPIGYPQFLYSWNQIIFLKVLFLLREDFSLKQIQDTLKPIGKDGLDTIIENIATSILGLFTRKDDGSTLRFLNFSDLENTRDNTNLIEAIQALIDCKQITATQFCEIALYINRDYLSNSSPAIHFDPMNVVNIILIKKELLLLAKELKIKDLDLKLAYYD